MTTSTRWWIGSLAIVAWAVFAILMATHVFSPREVVIPGPASSVSATPVAEPLPPAGVFGPNGTHRVSMLVASGESLWEIAERFYGDPHEWPRIMAANHIVNPNLIYPDQRLEIP